MKILPRKLSYVSASAMDRGHFHLRYWSWCQKMRFSFTVNVAWFYTSYFLSLYFCHLAYCGCIKAVDIAKTKTFQSNIYSWPPWYFPSRFFQYRSFWNPWLSRTEIFRDAWQIDNTERKAAFSDASKQGVAPLLLRPREVQRHTLGRGQVRASL